MCCIKERNVGEIDSILPRIDWNPLVNRSVEYISLEEEEEIKTVW